LPPQWCCGLPALGNGNLALAQYFARKNAASLSDYIDAGYDIIYSCTSCGLCLLRDYPDILKIPQARKIAENTYNIHEYIFKLINEGYAAPEFSEIPYPIAYHIPCHLRALKIGYPAAKLLKLIPGLKYEILDDACCGLSGSYGFKKAMQPHPFNWVTGPFPLFKKQEQRKSWPIAGPVECSCQDFPE